MLLCAAGAAQAADGTADSFTDMFTKGSANIDMRYRYENVDQDHNEKVPPKDFNRTASANTLRSRLTLGTAAWHGVSGLIEGDHVTDFGSDNYNSTENGNIDRPVIADPTGTDLNQVWLKYAGGNYDGTLGRQRILHGNQRFVGGVAWRQNEQTYDAFRAHWNPMEVIKLDVSYVNQVKRIFGPDDGANPADWEGDNYLARVDYQLNDRNTISAFGYWLDIDDDCCFAGDNGAFNPGKTVNNSTDTYGVEYRGNFQHLSIAASYDTQSEAGDSELDYDADYYMVELGTKLSVLNLKGGYEVLASDNGVGFKTPLATLHKFQGWADKFLGTPGDGIEDLYGSIGTKLGPVNMAVVYHDFQAEDSSEDFGTEWDVVATWKFTKRFSMQAKAASFDSDSDRYADTDKVWFTAQYKW